MPDKKPLNETEPEVIRATTAPAQGGPSAREQQMTEFRSDMATVDDTVIAGRDIEPGAPGEHVRAILDDHGIYRAVRDVHWYDQLVFRAGTAVSATHPGAPRWLADGDIERIDGQPEPASPPAADPVAEPAAVQPAPR